MYRVFLILCVCLCVCVSACMCVCVFSLVFSLKRANRAEICNFDCVISTNFTFWVFSVLTNFWPMFSHFILNNRTFVKICLLFQEEIYAPPQWVSYLLCVIYTKYTFEVVWNLDWFFVKVNLEPKTDQSAVIGDAADIPVITMIIFYIVSNIFFNSFFFLQTNCRQIIDLFHYFQKGK